MLMGNTHCIVYLCKFPNRRTLMKNTTRWMRNTRIFLFFKNFGGQMSFLWGHWYPPFWISGDVCPGFQSQGGLASVLSCLHQNLERYEKMHFCQILVAFNYFLLFDVVSFTNKVCPPCEKLWTSTVFLCPFNLELQYTWCDQVQTEARFVENIKVEVQLYQAESEREIDVAWN